MTSKIEQGQAKAAKLRQDMKRYAAGKRATKVATLQSEGASGRAELKRMRDVWYDTDKRATPGQYFNPKGKAHVVGRDQKARNILRGHNARKSQGKGI